MVSNVPKASEDLEDRESLAQLAASGDDSGEGLSADGETYIVKYTRSVGAVESILTLDRLRQNLAIKELLQGQPGSVGERMRKTFSVPNLSQLLRWQEDNSAPAGGGTGGAGSGGAGGGGRTGAGLTRSGMARSESLANFAAEILGIQSSKVSHPH